MREASLGFMKRGAACSEKEPLATRWREKKLLIVLISSFCWKQGGVTVSAKCLIEAKDMLCFESVCIDHHQTVCKAHILVLGFKFTECCLSYGAVFFNK